MTLFLLVTGVCQSLNELGVVSVTKKWSGQNRTSRTACYGPDCVLEFVFWKSWNLWKIFSVPFYQPHCSHTCRALLVLVHLMAQEKCMAQDNKQIGFACLSHLVSD